MNSFSEVTHAYIERQKAKNGGKGASNVVDDAGRELRLRREAVIEDRKLEESLKEVWQ